jgi:hypothetical protein
LFNAVLLNEWDVMVKMGRTRSQKYELLLTIDMLAKVFYYKNTVLGKRKIMVGP